MNKRVKRSLLEDVKIVYFAITCPKGYCDYCKNKEFCNKVENLLFSLIKLY